MCSGGGTYLYGSTVTTLGMQVQQTSDSLTNRTTNWGYDAMNRLASGSPSGSSGITFAATYDRFGNKWSSQYSGTGGTAPNVTYSFNGGSGSSTKNQISGFTYDAVGNLTSDGVNSYQYDAENNLMSISGATSATYVYDALNRRVKATGGAAVDRYGLDRAGRRETTWLDGAPGLKTVQFYAGSQPIAYWSNSDAHIHFEHGDSVGSDHLRTINSGSAEATYNTLPFGESVASSGTDLSPSHFALLDQDGSAALSLSHAMYRDYSSTQSRWLSIDPYAGSYDIRNPQSMNRYNYALNSPLAFLDPSGLQIQIACYNSGQQWAESEYGGSLTVYTTCFSYDDGIYIGGAGGTSTDTLGVGLGAGPSKPQGPAPSNGLKQKICSALPTGRTVGVSGGLGGVGSVGGGGEVVINYQSGQVSAFGFGGVQVGWNGGASGSAYTGFVYGLNGSNSNYSGGFTSVNGGAGFGGFAARSSGGLTGGAGGLLPASGVTAAGVSFGGGLLSGVSGGVSATNYSNPFQFGSRLSAVIRNLTPVDSLLYAAQQVCK